MNQPTPTIAHPTLKGVARPKAQLAWAGRAGKIFAASISGATGLLSIFAFVRTYGLAGKPQEAHLALGGFAAAWVGVTPTSDTAFAIDDTLHLVATTKDSRGSVLVGAPIRWTSDDPKIATVNEAGAVVARAAGSTTIAVTVGDRVGRARILVAQRPVALRVVVSDSMVGEGERRQLQGYVADANGYAIHGGAAPSWRSTDTTVATVDSTGMATGVAPGRVAVEASLHGMTARTTLQVKAIPGSIAVVGGEGQRATTGARLEQPVVARVLSTRGRPVPGATVRFAPSALAGQAEPATAVTDAQGRARTWWTLGGLPGRQRLVASVENVDSAATVSAEAEPTPGNVRVTALGAGQSAAAGEPLGTPVGVLVTDSLGRPLVDVPVTWLTPDGGTVAATSAARTDSLGEATAQWTLGPRAGAQQLRALIGTGRVIPPMIVGAVARPGAPAVATIVSGNAQRGTAGAALASGVAIRVRDRGGNLVDGATVTFSAADGTAADSILTTDSTGTAATRWTLGPRAGAQRLLVRVDGVTAGLTATAQARPAAAAVVTFDTAAAVAAAAKSAGSVPVLVAVTDSFGNPISNARLRLKTSSGTAAPTTLTTDAAGKARAKWTLGAAPGEQTLSASVAERGARGTLRIEVAPKAAKPAEAKPGKQSDARTTRSSASTRAASGQRRTRPR